MRWIQEEAKNKIQNTANYKNKQKEQTLKSLQMRKKLECRKTRIKSDKINIFNR